MKPLNSNDGIVTTPATWVEVWGPEHYPSCKEEETVGLSGSCPLPHSGDLRIRGNDREIRRRRQASLFLGENF